MKRMLTVLLLATAMFPGLAEARTRAELPAHAQVVSGDVPLRIGNESVAALRGAVLDGTAKQLMHQEPAVFELAATQVLQTMTDSMPSDAERDWVTSLLNHQPVLWQQHPETLADWFVPVFDLAAHAKALQHHWQQQEELAVLMPELEQQRSWTQAMLDAPDQLQATALKGLSPASRDRLMQQPVPPGLGALAWRALLHDQARVAIWEQALMMAPDDALRHSLPSVWLLEPAQARDWLAQVRLKRPALASVAVAALRHDPSIALRHEVLFNLLGSPRDHQSAAAALATDTAVTDETLIDAFLAAPRGLQQRALVLTLRLRDTATTRRFLASWRDAGTGDAALRESLR